MIIRSPSGKEKAISGLYFLSTLQTTESTENKTVQQGFIQHLALKNKVSNTTTCKVQL